MLRIINRKFCIKTKIAITLNPNRYFEVIQMKKLLKADLISNSYNIKLQINIIETNKQERIDELKKCLNELSFNDNINLLHSKDFVKKGKYFLQKLMDVF